MKKLAWVLSVCVLLGCAQSRVISKSEPVENPKPLTQKIRIIADSQQRVQGTPLIMTSDPVDRYVTDVTKRPVQQELFSRYLMKYLIHPKDGERDVPVIHLGDMLDGSCKYEWLKVREILRNKKDFVFVPGNHDGFMQGNFYSINDALNGWWAELCDEGRFQGNQHMRNPDGNSADCEPCADRLVNTIATKPYLINEYLALLAQNRYPSLAQKPAAAGGAESVRNEWQSDDPNDFLQKIAWKSCAYPLDFDGSCNGYNSYLLQMVKLPPAEQVSPPVYLLLLDTAQYEKPLKLGVTVLDERMAGVRGEIHEEQRQKAREWVEDVIRTKKGYVLLAGHHPFSSLNEGSQDFVAELTDKTGIRFYLSAHTHVGGWEYHPDYRMIELSVGSITDWPTHYRDFSIALHANKLLVRSTYLPIDLKTTRDLTGEDCSEDWIPGEDSMLSVKVQEKGKTSNYRKTQKVKTRFALLQYQELLNKFPGGDVARVFYVPATDIDCSRNRPPVHFKTAEELASEVGKTINELSEIEGYRDAARLANTINDYSGRTAAQETLMDTYKICQAVWASEADAKGSRAATIFEAIVSLNFSDYWTSRYEKLSRSEPSRRVDSAVVAERVGGGPGLLSAGGPK